MKTPGVSFAGPPGSDREGPAFSLFTAPGATATASPRLAQIHLIVHMNEGCNQDA
jgi:hypothetical protein